MCIIEAAGVLTQIERGNKKKEGIQVKKFLCVYHILMKDLPRDLSLMLTWMPLQWTKEEEEEFKAKVVDAYDKESSAYYSTARLWDDGIIDPADTRKILGLSVSAAMNHPPESTDFGVFRM